MYLFPAFVWRVKQGTLQQPGMIGYYLLFNQAMPLPVAFQADLCRDIKDEQAAEVAGST